MSYNMSTKFIHSVRVPRIYKECANTVKKVLVDGASFKTLVFKQNHPNVQGIYALVSETLHHCKELQSIIDQTKILIENPRFDPWLARVLITELLWGKKVIKSEAKPILTVLNYKEKLQQALVQNPDAAVDPCDKKKVKLPRYVRVNTLLTSIDETLTAFTEDGWRLLPRCDTYASHLKIISNMGYDDFIQDFHIPEVLIFPSGTKFHDHPGYLNGKFLLQDKASCLPAFLLNPKPNSTIMDMCSAPGMKTTHLAAIINNQGKIYAVEMKDDRYKTLCDFITHANAICVETIQADALTISPEQYPNIEYILVDPSCSGSGMVDRIEIRKEDQTNLYNRLGKLQSLQSMILNHALLNFPKTKRVAYSTCSIYPEENECVVDEAMTKFGDIYTLVDIRKELSNEWINFGSAEYSYYGDKCLYALPRMDHCSGFFLAVFERKPQKPEEYDVLQQTYNDCQDNDNGINDVQFSKPKKTKKRKIDGTVPEDFSNGYCAPELENNESKEILSKSKKTKKQKVDNTVTEDFSNGCYALEFENIQLEEIKEIQEGQLKKKSKQKINLEEEYPLNEHQFQNEMIVKTDENLEVEKIKLKKKKKKKKQKVDVEKIKDHCHDYQTARNTIYKLEENVQAPEMKAKKEKKNEKKIKDLSYKYQSQDEIIVKSEKNLEVEEIKAKKRKKNERKTNVEEIKKFPNDCQSTQNTICNLEENAEEREVKRTKKKKKKEKKNDSEEIENLPLDYEFLHEKINESDQAKSKKRKKSKTKEVELPAETPNEIFVNEKNSDSYSKSVKKDKKKKKNTKRDLETEEQ